MRIGWFVLKASSSCQERKASMERYTRLECGFGHHVSQLELVILLHLWHWIICFGPKLCLEDHKDLIEGYIMSVKSI